MCKNKMGGKVSLQERNFLLLNNDDSLKIVRKLLKSPLGLAEKLIILLNENKFSELKDNLDKIKFFVAGINRAEALSNDYQLAHYYPLMFAFHQFFNSSFRARQGKVLEAIMQELLKEFTNSNIVPKKVDEMQKIVQKSFSLSTQPTLDIDALGYDVKNKKIIIIQLRSRDDTGGTTAKGSLVDFLRELLRTRKIPNDYITYLIGVWDERNAQQRNSTISKIYSSIKEYIDIEEDEFYREITGGIEISKNMILKLAYGTTEISTALFEWNNSKDQGVLNAIRKITNSVMAWDDLWVSYAISSLELEVNELYNKSNIKLLENYLTKEQVDLTIFLKDTNNLRENIDKLAMAISSKWNEDSIPLSSVSDQILYIRDLIYLRLIYRKLIG